MDDATLSQASSERAAAAGTHDTPAGALLDAIMDECALALEALYDEAEGRFRGHVSSVAGIAAHLARYVDRM